MTFCSFFCDAQVHLSVSQVSVSLSVDCQHVGERPARPLGTLPTEGFEMLGKLVKTRGPNSGSASVACPPWRPSDFLLTDSCPHRRPLSSPPVCTPVLWDCLQHHVGYRRQLLRPSWSGQSVNTYIELLVVLVACLSICLLAECERDQTAAAQADVIFPFFSSHAFIFAIISY